MSPSARVIASVAFSVGATLVLMFAVSRFPGMEIPPQYWVFGTICPGIISFLVVTQLVRQSDRIQLLQREREDFMQLLSHDMRAPQASIIALLDHATPADWGPELAQRIRICANRTLKLADDMVQLSRAQLEQYKFEELNLVNIAHDAIDALTPQAHLRQISIEEAFESDEILIRGEPSLLARALINLLDNAVKFSAGPAVVHFAMTRTFRENREFVACSVIDQGVGIPDAQMKSLYGRFEGVRAGPARGIGGVGLGLVFVKAVVTGHGGTIHCNSEEGRGTTFRVELPLVA